MADTVVLANEYATLVYHEEQKIVHHTFLKPLSGEPFRNLLLTGIEVLKQHGAHKWLSDDRNMGAALPDEDTQWSMQTWFPQARAAGWKVWALVVPPEILARMNLKEFVDSYFEQGLRIMVFSDPEEAIVWLDKQ